MRSVGKLYEFLEFSQEKQDLAERVMITRLHLYGKWIKVGSFFNLQTKPFRREVFYLLTYIHTYIGWMWLWLQICDHTKIYNEISDENLELMRERLMETIIWPTDDTNTTEQKDS